MLRISRIAKKLTKSMTEQALREQRAEVAVMVWK